MVLETETIASPKPQAQTLNPVTYRMEFVASFSSWHFKSNSNGEGFTVKLKKTSENFSLKTGSRLEPWQDSTSLVRSRLLEDLALGGGRIGNFPLGTSN